MRRLPGTGPNSSRREQAAAIRAPRGARIVFQVTNLLVLNRALSPIVAFCLPDAVVLGLGPAVAMPRWRATWRRLPDAGLRRCHAAAHICCQPARNRCGHDNDRRK